MEQSVEFTYDAIGDILYINLVPEYAEQESDMIGDHVVARSNPATGEVENLEILFFRRTLEQDGHLRLPLEAKLLFNKALLGQWAEEDACEGATALPRSLS